MLCSGLIVLSGIFLPTLTPHASFVATLIFIGFLVGRLFSRSVDGKPNKQLVTGMFSEIILGAANAFFVVQQIID